MPGYDPTSARFFNAQPISEGRIVHYVLPDGKTLRPMLVVNAWNDQCVNGQAFLDGSNDDHHRGVGYLGKPGDLAVWVTSVSHDAGELRQNGGGFERVYNPHTWHWPERK